MNPSASGLRRHAHLLQRLVSWLAPLVLSGALLAVTAQACDRDSREAPEATPTTSPAIPTAETTPAVESPATVDAPADASAEPSPPELTPVARARDIEITLADYRRELQRAELGGGEPWNARTLADPFFQRNLLTRLLKREALREAAAERGIEVTDAEIRAELAARFGVPAMAEATHDELDALLGDAGAAVGREDLWRFVADDLLVEEMTAALLAELDDEALWTRYEAAHTRIGLDVVRLLNVPSSQEISHAVETRRDEIERWYHENKARYHRREAVTLRRFLVAVPTTADDAAVEAARERAEGYRRQALTGDLADLASRHSDDILTRPNGGLMPPVGQRQAGEAFELQVGEIGPVRRVRDGFEFVKLEGRTPASTRELGPGVEREIASILIQASGPAPSVAAVGQRVLDAWRAGDDAAVDALLAEHRSDRYAVAPFPADVAGRIPSLGYVPRVFEAAQATTPDQPVAEAPIADGEYVYVFRVTRREQADRLRFSAEKASFRAEIVEQERPRILWYWLDEYLGRNYELDLRAIQKQYGVLQKDGSIAGLDAPPG